MDFIKHILVGVVIVANLASTWLVPLIHMDFELRKDYIAKALCIERKKPISVCQGQCYLSAQLGKAAKQQQNEKRATPKEIVFFFHRSVEELVFKNIAEVSSKAFPVWGDRKRSDLHSMGVFIPPRS